LPRRDFLAKRLFIIEAIIRAPQIASTPPVVAVLTVGRPRPAPDAPPMSPCHRRTPNATALDVVSAFSDYFHLGSVTQSPAPNRLLSAGMISD